MRKLLFVIILILFASCRSPQCVVQETQRDSVRVEHKVIYVPDTVLVELPAQTAQRETKDSVSYLENDVASSEARISGGILFHRLDSKRKSIPVKIQKQIEFRDSVVYKDRLQTEIKEVNRLTWLQQAQIYGFRLALVLAAIALALRRLLKRP